MVGPYEPDVNAGWQVIEDVLTEVDVAGEPAWTISYPDGIEADDTSFVRLVPMDDSYVLGQQDRDLPVPDGYADRLYPGGGVIRAIVVDGLAAGTWALDRLREKPVGRVG